MKRNNWSAGLTKETDARVARIGRAISLAKGGTGNPRTLLENRCGRYKITVDDHDKMLAAQGGVCAICGKQETAKRKNTVRSLAIDHDHKTGKIRGLLCDKCNKGIAYFDDNAETLERAIKYLSK